MSRRFSIHSLGSGGALLGLMFLIVAGCGGPTGEGEKAIRRAEIHMRNGRYTKALDEYERVLASDPDHYEARLGLARCYLAKRELDKAREAFERSAQLRPQDGDPWLGLARVSLAQETPDHSSAVKFCVQAIQCQPERAELRAYLGNLYRDRGMHAEAETMFRDAVRLDPSSVAMRILLAQSLAEMGRLKEAEVLLERALGEDLGQSTVVQTALSRIREIEGDLEEGLSLLRELKGDQLSPSARQQRGRLCLRVARDVEQDAAEIEALREQAQADAQALLAFDHQNLSGLEIKGIALFDQEKYDDALPVFQEVRSLLDRYFKIPGDYSTAMQRRVAMLLLHLGRCYMETDLPRKAGEEFVRATNWDPNGIDAYFWSATAFLETGDRQAAAGSLEKMIDRLDVTNFQRGGGQGRELYPPLEDRFLRMLEHWAQEDPVPVSPLLALAQIQLRLGDPEGCIEWCEKASERAPNRPEAYYLQGAAFFQQGKNAEGLDALRAAKRAGPEFLPPYVRLAEIYRRGRRPDLAIREYRSALQERDDHPELMLGLARSYAALGDEASAIEELTDVLERDTDNLAALQMLTSIYVRRGRAWDPVAYDQMISLCDRILTREAMSEWALLVKAEAMIRKGDLDRAADILKTLSDAVPTSLPRSSAYASVLLLQGKTGETLDTVSMAQKISGATAELGILQAVAYLLQEKPEKAIPDLSAPYMQEGAPELSKVLTAYARLEQGNRNEAFRLLESLSDHGREERKLCEDLFEGTGQPSLADVKTLVRLALLSYRGWWSLAREEAQQLGRRTDHKACSLWWQAEAARNLKRLGEADRFLRELLEKAPYSGRAWVSRANIEAGTDPQKAIEYYRKAFPLFAGDIEWLSRIHFSVGSLLEQTGAVPEAIREYRLALEQDPEFGLAANNLAWLLVDENLEEAKGLAEAAVKAEPNMGAVRDTYGWICFQMGDFETALRELRLASTLEPYHPSIRYHAARAFYQAGDIPRVRAELQMALAIGIEFQEKEAAEKLLNQLPEE